MIARAELVCPHCHGSLTLPTLGKRQAEVLAFLVEYVGQHRYAPMFREIAAHFGFRSMATVSEHLRTLEEKGYIARAYNEKRGIRIVGTVAPSTAIGAGVLGGE